ncbi:hypothetical protein ABT116_31530, partial [Streptomyces sp. NPDC002130]
MTSETTASRAPEPTGRRRGEPLPHDLLDDGERLTREQLRELQLDRLRGSLRHAYDNVEAYRKKFDAAGGRGAGLPGAGPEQPAPRWQVG